MGNLQQSCAQSAQNLMKERSAPKTWFKSVCSAPSFLLKLLQLCCCWSRTILLLLLVPWVHNPAQAGGFETSIFQEIQQLLLLSSPQICLQSLACLKVEIIAWVLSVQTEL